MKDWTKQDRDGHAANRKVWDEEISPWLWDVKRGAKGNVLQGKFPSSKEDRVAKAFAAYMQTVENGGGK